MKFKECEFKYNASDIPLAMFEKFCQERVPLQSLHASGYDYFYQSSTDDRSFCRHRVGPDVNQLTFKRKTSDANNYVRAEHNIDLQKTMKNEQITALCAEFGYTPNSTIFKTCFIYAYDRHTLVYYICYDSGMKEIGRFMEIEASETHAWQDDLEPMDELIAMERICKPLGLTAQKRVKLSLYEMFKK